MSAIDDALQAIVQTQVRISIAEPIARVVKAAYLHVPEVETIANMLPCFTNTWQLTDVAPLPGPVVWESYSVNMRLHVAFARDPREMAARQAAQFMGAIVDAFVDATQPPRLDGYGGLKLIGEFDGVLRATCDTSKLRGGNPTFAVFGEENSPVRTIGLDLHLDLEFHHAG